MYVPMGGPRFFCTSNRDGRMVRAISLALIICGCIIMVYATFRYHGLLRYSRETTYKTLKSSGRTEWFSLGMLYVFIATFFVGFANALERELQPLYVYVTVVLFLSSFFIYHSVRTQIGMTARLHDKTMEIMRTFVNAIEMKDAYTKGHSEHVYRVVALLYDTLDAELQQRINKRKLLDAALLHDCGKISVEDAVLNKPGKLTQEDMASIKTHPLTGKKMLDDTCYCDISDWVLYHHERMDGKGYFGLRGEDIPMEARMIAVADTYSALSTDRVYRPRMSYEETVVIMREAAGTQLDPMLVDCFMRIGPKKLERTQPRTVLRPRDTMPVAQAS